MNQEAKRELIEQANQLAYDYIKHTGLFRSLENDQWDAKAEAFADKVLIFLEGLVDQELAVAAVDPFSGIEKPMKSYREFVSEQVEEEAVA